MDFLSETTAVVPNEKTLGFFEHVFKYDTHTKDYFTTTVQYVILSIIPIVLLNKSIQYIIPKSDDTKGNMEILMEIGGQLALIYVGLFLVHRIVSYLPLIYNNAHFEEVNLISFTLPFLVIVLSLQTKLGEKVDILYRRAVHYWTGVEPPSYHEEEHEEEPAVQVRQPIMRAETRQSIPEYQERKMTSTDMNRAVQYNEPQPQQQPQQQQQPPNFDAMIEPMAANEMGGSGFSAF